MTLDPGWLLLASVLALAVAVWAFQQARTVYRHRAVAEELRPFITHARKRLELASNADDLQRKRELDDLKFCAGGQWSEDEKRTRSDFDRRRLLDDGVVGVGLAKRRVH